jgi:hypothetical protein
VRDVLVNQQQTFVVNGDDKAVVQLTDGTNFVDERFSGSIAFGMRAAESTGGNADCGFGISDLGFEIRFVRRFQFFAAEFRRGEFELQFKIV